jgi:hypothetical protein
MQFYYVKSYAQAPRRSFKRVPIQTTGHVANIGQLSLDKYLRIHPEITKEGMG